MAKALIIDDEQDIRELISMAFSGINIDCDLAGTAKEGIKALKKNDYDFCITDLRLPDGDGLELVTHIHKRYPSLPVCVITAHGNVELAVKALKCGAFDFVNKPFNLDQLRAIAKAALKLASGQKASSLSAPKSARRVPEYRKMIGDSTVMKKLAAVLTKLARSQAPVFIYGESGTGKELAARSIHQQSARADGAFIAVNCGAIPETLVESEFFGYKKGAFTGANKDTPGLFASANDGTLFLDEVADLPLSMQVKLLRAIQERAIRPVGGDTEIKVDVRILSATHKDLAKLVAEKAFREDLFYRLNVIALGMPPLRKRKSDIPALTENFLEKARFLQGRDELTIDAAAQAKLLQYDYPGNIRELENVLERASAFCENDTITEQDIQFTRRVLLSDDVQKDVESEDVLDNYDFTDGDFSAQADELEDVLLEQTVETLHASKDGLVTDDLDGYLEKLEREAIVAALDVTNHNITRAAEKLGVSFRALRYKIKKLEIK